MDHLQEAKNAVPDADQLRNRYPTEASSCYLSAIAHALIALTEEWRLLRGNVDSIDHVMATTDWSYRE